MFHGFCDPVLLALATATAETGERETEENPPPPEVIIFKTSRVQKKPQKMLGITIESPISSPDIVTTIGISLTFDSGGKERVW